MDETYRRFNAGKYDGLPHVDGAMYQTQIEGARGVSSDSSKKKKDEEEKKDPSIVPSGENEGQDVRDSSYVPFGTSVGE